MEEYARVEVHLGPRRFVWKGEGENVSLCTSDTIVTVVKLKIHMSIRNKKCIGNSVVETYWEVRSKKNFVKINVASTEIDYKNMTSSKAGVLYWPCRIFCVTTFILCCWIFSNFRLIGSVNRNLRTVYSISRH